MGSFNTFKVNLKLHYSFDLETNVIKLIVKTIQIFKQKYTKIT